MHGMPQKTCKLGGFHTHVSRILLSCPSWEQLCQNEAADQKEAKSLSHPGTYRHKGGISVGQLLWTTCKPSDSLVIYTTRAYALRRQPHALDHLAPWSVHLIPQPPTLFRRWPTTTLTAGVQGMSSCTDSRPDLSCVVPPASHSAPHPGRLIQAPSSCSRGAHPNPALRKAL